MTLRLSQKMAILHKATMERAWSDYYAYVEELQARKDGTLIDGTCRVIEEVERRALPNPPPSA